MKSRARHSNGHVKSYFWPAVGTLSVMTGVPMGIAAFIELLRYQPYSDPGALGTAGWLGAGAILMTGLPLLILALKILRSVARFYAAWKRTLTPGQRTVANVTEFAVLEGTHLMWKHHNREVRARLTESVMGAKR